MSVQDKSTYTGDVLPIMRKVDKLTKKARKAEVTILFIALAVQLKLNSNAISSINGTQTSKIRAEIGAW